MNFPKILISNEFNKANYDFIELLDQKNRLIAKKQMNYGERHVNEKQKEINNLMGSLKMIHSEVRKNSKIS